MLSIESSIQSLRIWHNFPFHTSFRISQKHFVFNVFKDSLRPQYIYLSTSSSSFWELPTYRATPATGYHTSTFKTCNWLPLLAIHQVLGSCSSCPLNQQLLQLNVWCIIAAVTAVPGVTVTIIEKLVTPGTVATAATGQDTSSCRSCRVSCRMNGQLDALPALKINGLPPHDKISQRTFGLGLASLGMNISNCLHLMLFSIKQGMCESLLTAQWLFPVEYKNHGDSSWNCLWMHLSPYRTWRTSVCYIWI